MAIPSDVTLPITRSKDGLMSDALPLIVSRTRVAFGAGAPLAAPDPATWDQGLEAKYKDGKARGLLVRPIADALDTQAIDDEAGAVIVADAAVPYRLLIEVVFTLAMSGVSHIALAARNSVGGVVAVPLFLPRRGPDNYPVEKSQLNIAVRIDEDGYIVQTKDGPRAPGCHESAPATDAGAPITIGRLRSVYDDAALTACVTVLKAAAPTEEMVTLSAQSATDLQTVVRAVDALRGDAGTLLPKVGLGMSAPRGGK